MVLVVKNPPANARDATSIPGLGRSPGEGNRNPFPYSCLENPMDRGAWWATVHRVAESQTRRKQVSMHAHMHRYIFLLALSTFLLDKHHASNAIVPRTCSVLSHLHSLCLCSDPSFLFYPLSPFGSSSSSS